MLNLKVISIFVIGGFIGSLISCCFWYLRPKEKQPREENTVDMQAFYNAMALLVNQDQMDIILKLNNYQIEALAKAFHEKGSFPKEIPKGIESLSPGQILLLTKISKETLLMMQQDSAILDSVAKISEDQIRGLCAIKNQDELREALQDVSKQSLMKELRSARAVIRNLNVSKAK